MPLIIGGLAAGKAYETDLDRLKVASPAGPMSVRPFEAVDRPREETIRRHTISLGDAAQDIFAPDDWTAERVLKALLDGYARAQAA